MSHAEIEMRFVIECLEATERVLVANPTIHPESYMNYRVNRLIQTLRGWENAVLPREDK